MPKTFKLTLARLYEILRRQDPPQWGKQYDPAIRATREEAPSRSRPAQVWSERLERYCHTLSLVEQKVLPHFNFTRMTALAVGKLQALMFPVVMLVLQAAPSPSSATIPRRQRPEARVRIMCMALMPPIR